MYRLKKIVRSNNFFMQFIKIIFHCKTLGRKIDILPQTEYLVVNPITVCSFDLLFNCLLVGPTSNSLAIRLKYFSIDKRFRARCCFCSSVCQGLTFLFLLIW